jgi:hypothetical protein
MNFAITLQPASSPPSMWHVSDPQSTALRAADGPISTKLISTADYRIQSAIDARSANNSQFWQLYERK